MELRQPTAADIPALAHLMTELGYPTSPDEMATRMDAIRDRTDYGTFLADEDGVIAGVIGVTVAPALYRSDLNGAIVTLVVSSKFRGRGIAPLLVSRGEEWLREKGAMRATVQPNIRREDAHRLYARLGYEHSGLRFSKTLTP
ncbi:N-acetyltransferase [Terrihabitans soli]|uniref:N-acetyltransferase n=1 Tax=Terrihabitans soli TaxID=708113 RepID=A0A6S6QWP1_9HYPH|nr:GNAT family N-acetyltransferase [Terrihabitans soli]BCJ91450.1 N-acetyltransferase [Terrihabitans soli]